MQAIRRAIELLGGPAKAARALDVSTQAACFWRDGKRQVPADICPTIERLLNGAVRCEEMRGDVDWGYLRGTQPEEEGARA